MCLSSSLCDDQQVVFLEHNAVSLPLLVLELFPRQAIASHPHNKHCITHPQERNVHHMYQEEGPDDYINFQCTHLGHCPTPKHDQLVMR